MRLPGMVVSGAVSVVTVDSVAVDCRAVSVVKVSATGCRVRVLPEMASGAQPASGVVSAGTVGIAVRTAGRLETVARVTGGIRTGAVPDLDGKSDRVARAASPLKQSVALPVVSSGRRVVKARLGQPRSVVHRPLLNRHCRKTSSPPISTPMLAPNCCRWPSR
jgi:hypothetical protein